MTQRKLFHVAAKLSNQNIFFHVEQANSMAAIREAERLLKEAYPLASVIVYRAQTADPLYE